TTAGIEKVVSTTEVTTAGIEKVVSTAEVTTVGIEVTTASDLTLAQTLMEIRSARPKVKGVMIQEQGESTTTTTTRTQHQPSKDKGKGIIVEPKKLTKRKVQIILDEEVAQRLQAELQAELEEEERLVREKEEEANITLIESWDNVQATIDADYQLAEQLQAQETELVEAEVDDDQETAKIKEHMEIVSDEEEVAIDSIPLATKPPRIVDWNIHTEGKKSNYQIISANGKSQNYLVFSHMLKSFDREDLETLWKLVKANHGCTKPEEGYERVLRGDLKTMFERHVEDLVWRNLQGNKMLVWKLFD
ncbi:hypothetical protein Tco_1579058, partial [Tanacetum coccineum]